MHSMSERIKRGGRRCRVDGHRIRLPDRPVAPAEVRQRLTPPLAETAQIWRYAVCGTDERLVGGQPIDAGRGDPFCSAGPNGAGPRNLSIIVDGNRPCPWSPGDQGRLEAGYRG